MRRVIFAQAIGWMAVPFTEIIEEERKKISLLSL